MEYTIHKLAALSGVTTRTLRYYNQIGLLKPARTTEVGYRMYAGAQVARLQHILLYREMGLSLEQISALLDRPGFDRGEALRQHLAELERQRVRLSALILTVKRSIEEEEGGLIMNDTEKFKGFLQTNLAENEARYGAEIRENYGSEVVEGSNRRFAGLSQTEYSRMTALGDQIRAQLEESVRRGEDPCGEAGKALAGLHRQWLEFTWETYTPQAHSGLVRMYTEDARFTAYYDSAVPGCAVFLRDAVLSYVERA